MDRVELQTLQAEMRDDCRVVRDAFLKAKDRFERQEEVAHEGCAHQLCRMYNAIEQMGLRVAKAFENSIDDEKGWHSGLLNRLSIRIDGVRPAVFPSALRGPLNELKGFRHIFTHAYELELDPEKLALLLKYAKSIADAVPSLVDEFILAVAREQQIAL